MPTLFPFINWHILSISDLPLASIKNINRNAVYFVALILITLHWRTSYFFTCWYLIAFIALRLMLLLANLANAKWSKNTWEMTETLAHGYEGLSQDFKNACPKQQFRNFCPSRFCYYSTFNSLLCHKSQFTGLTEEKKIRPGQKRTPIPLSPDSVPLTHYDQHQDSSPFTDYQHIVIMQKYLNNGFTTIHKK